MKNFTVFIFLWCVLVLAMFLGSQQTKNCAAAAPLVAEKERAVSIPWKGSIQILNGCGVIGAANNVADFLRSKDFDVKNKGNAPTNNYPSTIVVSRKKDSSIARQVAQALRTDKIVQIRNSDETYDVTVFVGADFLERTK